MHVHCFPPAPTHCLVEAQLADVARIGLKLAPLHAFDDVGEHGVGPARLPNLVALAHNQAVQKLNLGAAALQHILTHRRSLFGRCLLGVLETLLVASLDRRPIALSGPRDGLRLDVQDLFQLIA